MVGADTVRQPLPSHPKNRPMLTFQLRYSTRRHVFTTVDGRMACVGDAAETMTYRCELLAGEHTPALRGRFRLERSAFVALPILVARGIGAALSKRPAGSLDLRPALLEAQLTLSMGNGPFQNLTCWRLFEAWDEQHTWEDRLGTWPAHGPAAVTPWRLAQYVLWRAAADAKLACTAIPPVHLDRGTQYCLSSELPQPLRQEFERSSCLQTQPHVDGHPDAFHVHDVARFLALKSARVVYLENM